MRRILLIRQQRNRRQFREMIISPDLIGQWIVEFRGGLVGQDGDTVRRSYETEADALREIHRKCRKFWRAGYDTVGDGALVPTSPPPCVISPESDFVRSVDQLERLLGLVPGVGDTRFGRLIGSLASIARHKRPGRNPSPDPRYADSLFLTRDDIDYRIRARVFQLLDVIVSAILTDADMTGLIRPIRDAANPTIAGNVIRVVPRSMAAYLDFAVARILLDDRSLAVVAHDMRRAGVRFVGQLVQLPFDTLLDIAQGDRQTVAGIEARLLRVGLRLHSRAPWWRPPDRRYAVRPMTG